MWRNGTVRKMNTSSNIKLVNRFDLDDLRRAVQLNVPVEPQTDKIFVSAAILKYMKEQCEYQVSKPVENVNRFAGIRVIESAWMPPDMYALADKDGNILAAGRVQKI